MTETQRYRAMGTATVLRQPVHANILKVLTALTSSSLPRVLGIPTPALDTILNVISARSKMTLSETGLHFDRWIWPWHTETDSAAPSVAYLQELLATQDLWPMDWLSGAVTLRGSTARGRPLSVAGFVTMASMLPLLQHVLCVLPALVDAKSGLDPRRVVFCEVREVREGALLSRRITTDPWPGHIPGLEPYGLVLTAADGQLCVRIPTQRTDVSAAIVHARWLQHADVTHYTPYAV